MNNHRKMTGLGQAEENGMAQVSRFNRHSIYAGGRVVGVVVGDTFHKWIDGKRHFLRKPPAIAFDVQSVRDAEQAGAHSLRVVDNDTGTVYTQDIQTLWREGFTFNRGYGEQVALLLKAWIVNGNKDSTAVQLGLFDE